MSKPLRIFIILLLIVSPVIVGTLFQLTQPPTSVFGIMEILTAVFGIPSIGIVGLIVSYFTRNTGKTDLYSILGYAVPAVIVCSWEVGILQPVLIFLHIG